MTIRSQPDVTGALLAQFRAGKRYALARAITLVENGLPGFESFLDSIHPDLGRARRVGLTGPPGAGKSTLISSLASPYLSRGETVGVIAVDPSSPFSGGALLGDRIRMNHVATDAGVFIRSMATRGSVGGLAVATSEVTDVMDAFGFDHVITETVGVGQSELEIAETADTTVVILVPESGDAIQAMKAGLMEIADVFVINKADRPGADRLAQELELMLHMRLGEAQHPEKDGRSSLRGVGRAAREEVRLKERAGGGWAIPVLKTVAQSGEGVAELVSALDSHREYLEESGELSRRRQRRVTQRVRAVVARELDRLVWDRGRGEEVLAESRAALESGEESPYTVAARIVRASGVRPEADHG